MLLRVRRPPERRANVPTLKRIVNGGVQQRAYISVAWKTCRLLSGNKYVRLISWACLVRDHRLCLSRLSGRVVHLSGRPVFALFSACNKQLNLKLAARRQRRANPLAADFRTNGMARRAAAKRKRCGVVLVFQVIVPKVYVLCVQRRN